MFGCFVDFSKAFDRVNYWKLFNKLLDDGVELLMDVTYGTVAGFLVPEKRNISPVMSRWVLATPLPALFVATHA